jgi:putative oxidoreductase
MIKKYLEPLAPYVPTVLRILVGLIFLLHGLPKWQGLDGFAGFLGTLGVPLPGVFAFLVALLETGGGLLLILGLGTRWVALLFVIEMILTTLLVKVNVGFISPTATPGVGAELDLLLLVCAFALAVLGSGPLSVEQNVLRREL